MTHYRQTELEWSKFSVVVKQMSSDNAHIRALALESLERMVESEVNGGKELKKHTDSNKNKTKTVDVMQRIRLLQHEKQSHLQRRKKWFNMI